jgi:structural maintenance of chromosome 1
MAKVDRKTFSEKQNIKSLKRQHQTVSESVLRLQETLDTTVKQQKDLKKEKRDLKEGLQQLRQEISGKTVALREVELKMQEMEKNNQRLHQLEIETTEKLEATVKSLMQANVDRQDSGRSKKFKEALESLSRIFPNVYGKLQDLCKPTQRKYDLAASIILGKNMDAIVVDTEKTAIECIKYLREQRSGQAKFLPLDTLQTKAVNESYRALASGSRLAIDVIKCEANCEAALLYAVGDAVISDTVEIAKYIRYEKQTEVKVVALDGTVIHKTGMITGGVSDSTRAKEWEERDFESILF